VLTLTLFQEFMDSFTLVLASHIVEYIYF